MFDALRRKTARELMKKIDPLTFNENIQVIRKSKNIIFEGVFDEQESNI